MIVSSEKIDEVKEFMRDLDRDMKAKSVTDFKITRLQNDLRKLSRDGMSVQRSCDEKRIHKFNQLYVSKVSELSRIVQENGFSNRDDAAELVRQVKAQ